MYAAK